MYIIRTGIPSVDELFRQRDPHQRTADPWDPGVRLPDRSTTTSFCIVGPDGAGKSVLAMHLASRYLADCAASDAAQRPHVFYISSDLTFPVAQTMWLNFGLHAPNARLIPFQHPQFRSAPLPAWMTRETTTEPRFDPNLRLWMHPYGASRAAELAEHLQDTGRPSVGFVDLASHTAGDDWSFIQRFLAVLPLPGPDGPRHLVIIDAVEGLETFGGDVDAFGHPTPRRARIAKLMRLAAGKCHVVLIIEEPAEGVRLPEQFVADIVVRLRSIDAYGYIRRTIEIEKARGQPIVRGRHPYVVRPGTGSTTGKQQNADDPRLEYRKEMTSAETAAGLTKGYDWPAHQSYVMAFPSIHQISRSIMEDCGQGRQQPGGQRAGFGIHYLDQMLGSEAGAPAGDERGLPCSTVTALIGDAGTQKSGLGLTFLAHAFHECVARMAQQVLEGGDAKTLIAEFTRRAGVAVLITTHDESQEMLAKLFLQHLASDSDIRAFVMEHAHDLEMMIRNRTICRRLEIHDTPAAVLLHTIRRAIEAAQQICMNIRSEADGSGAFCDEGLPPEAEARFTASWPIRLVIDDFSTIMDTYAQLRTDQLFLPFLLFYLRREGVTSLIEDTRAGGPYAPMEGFHTDLRAMSDYRIYTWHVTDFYGDHRVAIAPIPPVSRTLGVVVRELQRRPAENTASQDAVRLKGNLHVDLRFELYAGLEENKPRPVPVNVRLYAETEACRRYAAYLNTILEGVFTPIRASSRERRSPIVITEDPQYDRLRDLAFLQADNRLDHTLVFQVDEFWMGRSSFRNEWDYLWEARVARNDKVVDKNLDDPYNVYQQLHLAKRSHVGADLRRADFYDVPGCDLHPGGTTELGKVDRIPYAIDYGFLECRYVPWQHAALMEEARHDSEKIVSTVWDTTEKRPKPQKSWRDFLAAACRVAEFESEARQQKIASFDLSMIAPESFSCLVLEVWCSEIARTLRRQPDAQNSLAVLGKRSWRRETGSHGLLEWLTLEKLSPKRINGLFAEFPAYSLELYKAWLLLVEALDLDALRNAPGAFAFKSGRMPNPLAVASRHWYKTASATSVADPDVGPRAYSRLPGAFTTRGDWFLAVATGSRSNRLGNRILDLLCSTRANANRLREGIGLPTRRLLRNPQRDANRLRTALRTEPTGKGRLTYEEVLALGPTGDGDQDFGWLWRSSLRDYYRQSHAWQGWLYRMLRISQTLRERERAPQWKSGFVIYDAIVESETSGALPGWIPELTSYQKFPSLCNDLIAQLEQVSAPIQ